jgi:outer membrane protein assembly factor BamB
MKKIILRIGFILAVLAAILLFTAEGSLTVSAQAPTASSAAVAYQINPLHSGAINFSPSLTFPLTELWRVDLVGSVSYPLIADSKVFVTVANTNGYGTKLYALDETTGHVVWGPIAINGTYNWSNAAYENGKVFVVNFDGLMSAFNAADGTLAWSTKLPGQYAFSSPPTALKGIVYTGGAGSGGTVYAVSETNGAVLWTQPVENGDHSSPAVTTGGVFVSYPCQVYKFNPTDGQLLWHYSGGCEGGGGRTPAFNRGRLYVRDWSASPPGYVFDALTGNVLGRFSAGPIPALKGNYGFVLNAGTFQALDLRNGNVLWSFAGDGTLSSAPLIVNQNVFIGAASGLLYALGTPGKVVWSTNVGAPIPAPDEQNVSQPLTGLAAADGTVFVPAGHLLVAYH